MLEAETENKTSRFDVSNGREERESWILIPNIQQCELGD